MSFRKIFTTQVIISWVITAILAPIVTRAMAVSNLQTFFSQYLNFFLAIGISMVTVGFVFFSFAMIRLRTSRDMTIARNGAIGIVLLLFGVWVLFFTLGPLWAKQIMAGIMVYPLVYILIQTAWRK